MTRIRAFAQREPLIVRQVIVYTVSGAGWVAARYFGVELDTEATVLLLLSVVGLAAGVAREGVTPKPKATAPASIQVGSPTTANSTLLAPPDVAHTVTDTAQPFEPPDAGDTHDPSAG